MKGPKADAMRTTVTERRALPALVSTVCSIGIRRDASGRPTGLSVYPSTPLHPVIYHMVGTRPVSPELPMQVRWTVNTLRSDESIRIERKSDVFPVFPWERKPLELTPSKPEAVSGPAIGQLPSDRGVYWHYSIELWSPDRKLLDLDPVIIIDPDPTP